MADQQLNENSTSILVSQTQPSVLEISGIESSVLQSLDLQSFDLQSSELQSLDVQSELQQIFSDVESESTQDSQNSDSAQNSESESTQNSGNSGSSQNSDQNRVEYEMIQGKRRDKMILHSEHQLYVRNKVLANGSIAYTCKESNCHAQLYVKDGVCFFTENFRGHTHGDKKKEIVQMKLLTQIKEKCAKPSASQISEVREIFDEAVIKWVFVWVFFIIEKYVYVKNVIYFAIFLLRRDQNSDLNFNKHRRNFLQIRNKSIPKPPTNVREVIDAYKNKTVIENYSRTKHENVAYECYKGSYECDEFSYSYFASDHVMNNIRENIPEEKREFLMDATFKIFKFTSHFVTR